MRTSVALRSIPSQQSYVEPTINTPTGGLVSQTPTTPGTSVYALQNGLNGGYIYNPIDAPAPLLVDPVQPASTVANGTTMAILPGQCFFAIPNSATQVSVASTVANHQFVAVQW